MKHCRPLVVAAVVLLAAGCASSSAPVPSGGRPSADASLDPEPPVQTTPGETTPAETASIPQVTAPSTPTTVGPPPVTPPEDPCADQEANAIYARGLESLPPPEDHTPAAIAASGAALAYFELAAEMSPDCPQLHLAVARLCAGFPSSAALPPDERFARIDEAANAALNLDPQLAEAHVLLGLAEMDRWRWAEADRSLRRAVQLAEDNPATHAALARFLAATGRFDEAIGAVETARSLAPDAPHFDIEAGGVYHLARDHERAVELLRPAAEAGMLRAQFLLGWAYAAQSHWEEAAWWFERVLPLTNRDAGALLSLAYVYALDGHPDRVPAMLAEVEEAATRMYVPMYRIAVTYLALGERETALDWLERAMRDDRGWLAWIGVDPVVDPLRMEPRFRQVLQRVGLPSAPGPAAAAVPGDGGWIPLFNGRNLEGWTPKFAGHPLGVNHENTFRVVDGVLRVTYEDYDGLFDDAFGHLFYTQPFSHYRLRLEYRFFGEQLPGAPGWAFRNSGVMIHGQDPATMRVQQPFPVSIEVQLLGGDGVNDRPTGNVCTPGTHVVIGSRLDRRHCIESTSATYHHDDWVTLEIEVRGGQVVRHLIYGGQVMEYSQPQLDPADPDAAAWLERRGGEVLLEGGTISLQAESHPCEFRRIELLPLEPGR